MPGDLLSNPDIAITTYPVDLGGAAGDGRMTNHVLRGYEQGIMDAANNVPKEGGGGNDKVGSPARIAGRNQGGQRQRIRREGHGSLGL